MSRHRVCCVCNKYCKKCECYSHQRFDTSRGKMELVGGYEYVCSDCEDVYFAAMRVKHMLARMDNES